MRTFALIVVVAVVTALVSLGVSGYVFYNKWQFLRATLESVLLTEPVEIQPLTLAQASEKLVEQVRRKKQMRLVCVFSPPALGDRRATTFAKLDGTAFFGVKALEESYQCHAEFAGSDTILFTEKDG